MRRPDKTGAESHLQAFWAEQGFIFGMPGPGPDSFAQTQPFQHKNLAHMLELRISTHPEKQQGLWMAAKEANSCIGLGFYTAMFLFYLLPVHGQVAKTHNEHLF